VKFHDGEAFTAEAAKYSLERHLNMKGSFRKPELGSVDKVEIVDPTTIKLVLKEPFSPLIAQLTDRAGMMVSPKAAKESSDKFGLKPVCAGPYKFVERVQQDRIVVEKFADYWDKANVFIDRIVYLPITDSTVRLANLKSGQLDLIERALATDIKEIKATKNIKLATALELGYQGMTMNIAKSDAGKAALGLDPRVREALDLAIDRKALNEVVFNGEFVPGNQWVNPENPWYMKKFPVQGRDIEKAKKLMKDAGVKTPLAIDFMVPNNPETRQVAEVIQSMAAEAGFDMKIRISAGRAAPIRMATSTASPGRAAGRMTAATRTPRWTACSTPRGRNWTSRSAATSTPRRCASPSARMSGASTSGTART